MRKKPDLKPLQDFRKLISLGTAPFENVGKTWIKSTKEAYFLKNLWLFF